MVAHYGCKYYGLTNGRLGSLGVYVGWERFQRGTNGRAKRGDYKAAICWGEAAAEVLKATANLPTPHECVVTFV